MSSYGLGFLSATAPWTGAADVSISYTDTASSTNNTSTYSFSGISFGTAASNRVVAVSTYVQSIASISDVTIGGISATKAVELYATNATSVLAVYYATVPTGTSGTVAVRCSDAGGRCAIAAYRIIPGYSSAPSFASSAVAETTNISEVTGGSSIYVFLRTDTKTFSTTRNGVSLTPDVGGVFGGPNYAKLGNIATTGNPNAVINSTYAGATGGQGSIIVAHWR
jgi:hypothetical protein